jgi:hypothetical protein
MAIQSFLQMVKLISLFFCHVSVARVRLERMRVGVLAVQMADRGVPVGGAGDQSGGRAHPGHVPVARERYLPLQVGHLPYQLDGCDPLRAGGHGRGARHQTPLVACRSIRYVFMCRTVVGKRLFILRRVHEE